jgi:predicted neutral ceramidase superfamily lipid hydrolase
MQKVNSMKCCEGDKSFIKLIGLKDTVEVITSDCGVPFASIIILDRNNICCGMDGFEYFLTRKIE